MKSEDITGGLDLLGDWLDAKGYTEEAGLCTRAMDEINALRAQNMQILSLLETHRKQLRENDDTIEALRAENARLKEEYEQALQMCMNQARTLKRWSDMNEKLREALKPFADEVEWLDSKYDCNESHYAGGIKCGHIRAARDALIK